MQLLGPDLLLSLIACGSVTLVDEIIVGDVFFPPLTSNNALLEILWTPATACCNWNCSTAFVNCTACLQACSAPAPAAGVGCSQNSEKHWAPPPLDNNSRLDGLCGSRVSALQLIIYNARYAPEKTGRESIEIGFISPVHTHHFPALLIAFTVFLRCPR